MKIKYRKGIVSDCGLYYHYKNNIMWRHEPSQDYIVITVHSIMRRFDIYNKFRAYMGSVDHFKETKGMLNQAKKLLIINPNHHYRDNIETTIYQYEENIKEQQKEVDNYSKIFKLLYN